MIDHEFIKRVEAGHFRTNQDTGANANALFIWNLVRKEAGLEPLSVKDLPAFCAVHQKYHIIREEYGCVAKV
jgi:hypothetical protein